MQTRRKTHEESCFSGLKAVIKKSGTTENPDILFHACPRYRKGNHCNYFKWVDDDDYQEWLKVEQRKIKKLIYRLKMTIMNGG
ncbi:hypothetical protein Ahy_B09g096183 [Arachis hypogaea]|uniref:GRF-type domain-containing protein n=1 Tax=Arachis hypogaea TaxID=3818 RepID=A0A444XIZ8_ARAHY|nr:hypothetical protein Ahy_B09g096183 [Arachis hypogaea]